MSQNIVPRVCDSCNGAICFIVAFLIKQQRISFSLVFETFFESISQLVAYL